MTETQVVEIATDGACKGNPGPGGWGALIRLGDKEKEISGGEPNTTNNRMELRAAIEALNALKRPCRVKLSIDSTYVKDGITKWIFGWQKNGWRTAARKPVKNADLWQELLKAVEPHQIEWQWVKGHAGDADNERADLLASDAAMNVARNNRDFLAIVFNLGVRSVFLDRTDRIFRAGLAGIAFGRENNLAVIFEANAKLAFFVFPNLKFMRHLDALLLLSMK